MKKERKTKFEVFLEMYNQNKPREEIARAINVKLINISGYISLAKKKGLLKVQKKTRMAKVIALYKQGKKCPEIAEELGLNEKTIRYYITQARSLGLIANTKRSQNLSIKRVAELCKEEKTKEQIAKILGLEESTVKYYVFEARKIGYLENKTKIKSRGRKKYTKHTNNIEKLEEQKEEKEKEVLDMYARGKEPEEIICKLGITKIGYTKLIESLKQQKKLPMWATERGLYIDKGLEENKKNETEIQQEQDKAKNEIKVQQEEIEDKKREETEIKKGKETQSEQHDENNENKKVYQYATKEQQSKFRVDTAVNHNLIVKLFEKGNYPGMIAKKLGIRKFVVYKCLEQEAEKCKEKGENFYQRFLSQNRYYQDLLKRKEKNPEFKITKEQLRSEETIITPKQRMDLADLYYLIDDEYGMQRVLNININNEIQYSQESTEKLNMLMNEQKDRRIRKTYRMLCLSKKTISYDMISLKVPDAKIGEISDVVGRSEISTISKESQER